MKQDKVTAEKRIPFGPCERDADGACIGKCGRIGHLGRPLTIDEWLSFFGPVAINARRGGGGR